MITINGCAIDNENVSNGGGRIGPMSAPHGTAGTATAGG